MFSVLFVFSCIVGLAALCGHLIRRDLKKEAEAYEKAWIEHGLSMARAQIAVAEAVAKRESVPEDWRHI